MHKGRCISEEPVKANEKRDMGNQFVRRMHPLRVVVPWRGECQRRAGRDLDKGRAKRDWVARKVDRGSEPGRASAEETLFQARSRGRRDA